MTFGDKLRQEINDKFTEDVPWKALSIDLSTEPGLLRKYLLGEGEPTMKKLRDISKGLGITMAQLLEDVD